MSETPSLISANPIISSEQSESWLETSSSSRFLFKYLDVVAVAFDEAIVVVVAVVAVVCLASKPGATFKRPEDGSVSGLAVSEACLSSDVFEAN